MGADCQNSLDSRCVGINSNQGHWIRGEMFLQRFLPTISGSSKQSEWQSKYPISQIPPAWDFSLRQQQHQVLRNWKALLILLIKVTPSHIYLPCWHPERQTESLPGRPAIKHHRRDYFGGIFLISRMAALTFVSLPFPFLLFFCFNILHTQPLPLFLLCFPSPGFTFKWRCILSHPHGTEAVKQ